MKHRTVALSFAFAVAVAPPAAAYVHFVRRGETLADIARRAYGDARYEAVLVGANGLDAQGGATVVPGMRIEVPAPSHYTCTGTETWAALGEAWLGDGKRGDELALYNNAVPWVAPKTGQEIAIPFVLAHVAGDGETTIPLAARYLGDANRAWELDRYNGLTNEKLTRGQLVLVPLLTLTLTEEGRADALRGEAQARSEGLGQAREGQKRADAEIPTLLADVRGGRYVEGVARGNRLLGTGVLTRPQRARVHRLLLEAYVALEAPEAAAAACAAWKQNESGSVELDPARVSPKVRAVCTPH